MVQMQALECFLHRLMAGETGPLMVSGPCIHGRHLKISPGLLQPVARTVHAPIVRQGTRAIGSTGCCREPHRGPCALAHLTMV